MNIPQDVERLMWLVAEKGDPTAIADFVQRFPDLQPELNKRLTMIRGLKDARGDRSPQSAIPAFRLRSREPSRLAPRTLWTIGALGFAALAAASYTISSSLSAPLKAAPPVESKGIVERGTAPQEAPPVAVATTEPKKFDSPAKPAGSDSETTGSSDVVTPGSPSKPIKAKVSRTPLLSVLTLVAEPNGLKLVVGPGMPNPTIDVDYSDQTPMQILEDLGRIYGFTVFDQGDGTVNVIPAVEHTAAGTDPAPANSSRAGSSRTSRPSDK